MSRPLVAIRALEKRYGGVRALSGITLDIPAGTALGVIGPNGAGKTTLFDVLTGIEPPDAGTIFFDDVDVTGFSPVRIARLGLARSFQNCQVFHNLTIIENVLLGRYLKTDVSFFMAGIRPPAVYREEHRNLTRAFGALDFLDLYDRADRKISQVSSFTRRRVEIARCLAMEPRLLLLDEPFGGLGEREKRYLADRLHALRAQGMTLVLIDHHFDLISNISDNIAVLHQGRIIAKGKPGDIRENAQVVRAYLGG